MLVRVPYPYNLPHCLNDHLLLLLQDFLQVNLVHIGPLRAVDLGHSATLYQYVSQSVTWSHQGVIESISVCKRVVEERQCSPHQTIVTRTKKSMKGKGLKYKCM